MGVALLKKLQPDLMRLGIEYISNFYRDLSDEGKIDGRELLVAAKLVHITRNELKRVEEQFYLDQAFIKLQAADVVQGYTDNEIAAFRLIGQNLHVLGVYSFQKKLLSVKNEFNCAYNQYLAISMELMQIESEIDGLCERKTAFREILKRIKFEYKKYQNKSFFQRILDRTSYHITSKSTFSMVETQPICENDIDQVKRKVTDIDGELQDWKNYYWEKVNTIQLILYREIKNKTEECKLKKEIYSKQLCELLNSTSNI